MNIKVVTAYSQTDTGWGIESVDGEAFPTHTVDPYRASRIEKWRVAQARGNYGHGVTFATTTYHVPTDSPEWALISQWNHWATLLGEERYEEYIESAWTDLLNLWVGYDVKDEEKVKQKMRDEYIPDIRIYQALQRINTDQETPRVPFYGTGTHWRGHVEIDTWATRYTATDTNTMTNEELDSMLISEYDRLLAAYLKR